MPKTDPAKNKLANAIRILAADSVQQANSGHPGMPMGMADIATVLWHDFLQHNPQDPDWVNRDRFVLSNGHGSMLLYALLHLSGYDLSMQDLKDFRQFGSKTAGHPELETVGVETTTGPLGQGLANGVGMAIAECNLAREFNTEDLQLISHYTYVFAGDGCLMEGISHEACSLAGTLGLGKLICFFDDNGISIDGEVKRWCSDDVKRRFESYNWEVIGAIDGHDAEAISAAISQAQKSAKPSLIICKTHIAFGSPNKQGTAGAHGAALGADEIKLVRQELAWEHEPFTIPQDIYDAWDQKARGKEAQDSWSELYAKYKQQQPDKAEELDRRLKGELPKDFQQKAAALLPKQNEAGESMATRQSSLQALEYLSEFLPELLGGSADLTGSNCTMIKSAVPINEAHQTETEPGNYIYYGVRELAMSAIMNGMALHKGYIPFGGTFLVFLDYSRSAVRLAALMKQKVIFVFSHDSIGVGEDGPTHQPVEHLAMLRHTPGINVWRPADTVETAAAWIEALQAEGPSALVISRQKLAFQKREQEQINAIAKGAYQLVSSDNPELAVIATGSELEPAREAVEKLNQEGKKVSLVSMPCTEAFDKQPDSYKKQVLPLPREKCLAVEAAATDYWLKYAAHTVGMESFGSSAPADALFKHFKLTAADIYQKIKTLI